MLFGVTSLVDHDAFLWDGTLPTFGRHDLHDLGACVAFVSIYQANTKFIEYIMLRRAHGTQDQQSSHHSEDRERSRRGTGTETYAGAGPPWRRW
jgi:hypothetical protein